MAVTWQEAVERRTRAAKTYRQMVDGSPTPIFRALVHGKSLHYQETPGQGPWLDIDPQLAAAANGWNLEHNYWTAQFADLYSAQWPVTIGRRGGFTLRYKFAVVGHVSRAKKLTVLQTAQPAAGIVMPHPDNPAYHVLRYPEVFTGIAVEHVPDHDYLKARLIVSEAGKAGLLAAILAQGLDEKGFLAVGALMDLSQMGGWVLGLHDGEETDGAIVIKRPLSWPFRANDHLEPLTVNDGEGLACPALYQGVDRAEGRLVLILIPLAWLRASVGQVVIDPSYYAESNDGYLYYSNADYATCRTGPANSCNETGTTMYLGQKFATPTYTIYRGYLSFDTSAIPDDATVTAATLALRANYDGSATDFKLQVYWFNWTETICLNKSTDWPVYGSGTLEGTFRDTADGWVSGIEYTMAISTLANINKTGDTKMGLVSKNDVDAVAPTQNEYVVIRTQEQTGESEDPRLDVTYSSGGVPRQFMHYARMRK